MNKSARNDALAAVLVLIVAVPFIATTGDIFIDPFDPGFSAQDFPIGTLGLIVILALVLAVRSIRTMLQQGIPFYEKGEMDDLLRWVAPMVIMGFLYVWLIVLFQYPLPTFLIVSAALAMFGNRGLGRLLVAPLLAAFIYYVLFYGLLGLHEVPGEIWEYENQTFFRPLRDALGLF